MIHGLEGTRQYRSWQAMKNRCLNSRGRAFRDYGARGITVCERWRNFTKFWEDMGPSYGEKLKLERIDNNGPYCPENCRWATHKDQCNNRRSSRFVTAFGDTLTLGKWSEKTGLQLSTIWMRLNRGWDPELAVSKKP